MTDSTGPLIPTERKLPEITLKVVLLSIILSVVLAASNTYLALKIGILMSASIPAAILSMGILGFFKKSNILENNLVQTAASAGEAVAGGIVYTIPGLVIIRYWLHFPYFECFAIALLAGVLGVFFSIPLRRVLMTAPHLNFPEGRAIAEVLKAGSEKVIGFKEVLLGGLVGGVLELAQTGFKIVANNLELWFTLKRGLFGFGAGFSPAMIGAGYLIGFNLGLSLLIGAIVGWLITVPIISEIYPIVLHDIPASHAVMQLWSEKVRYIGIGSMLFAGLWTLLTLAKPFIESIRVVIKAVGANMQRSIKRTEKDMPLMIVLTGVIITSILLYFLFHYIFPKSSLGSLHFQSFTFISLMLLYVLIAGFIISAITAYFSGLVGVTATPGSAIVIVGFLLAALIIDSLLSWLQTGSIGNAKLLDATAVTIILGSVITGAAAISNDNIQDLKVGHILGATPWKQQVMLLLGVVVASLVIPFVLELLFNVYGIAGVFPHSGMDKSQVLAAPVPAMLTAITQAVFNHNLPWTMILIGVAVAIIFILINIILKRRNLGLSVLGVSMGMYLPLSASTPIFMGGLIAYLTKRKLQINAEKIKPVEIELRTQKKVVLACGLVAGAAIMDVILAIPFSIMHSPDALSILPHSWYALAAMFTIISTLGIGVWFYRGT